MQHACSFVRARDAQLGSFLYVTHTGCTDDLKQQFYPTYANATTLCQQWNLEESLSCARLLCISWFIKPHSNGLYALV